MRLKDKRSYLLISEYVQRAELRRQIKIGMKRRTRRREPNRIVPRFSSIPKPQSAWSNMNSSNNNRSWKGDEKGTWFTRIWDF